TIRIELRVDEGADQVAIPRCGARQRTGRRVVLGVAGEDRVAAVVRPGRPDTRLQHLAERDLVHVVLVPGRGHESGERGFVLAQPLAVERVVAREQAGVERPVLPPDGVVRFDALRPVLRVYRRGGAARL